MRTSRLRKRGLDGVQLHFAGGAVSLAQQAFGQAQAGFGFAPRLGAVAWLALAGAVLVALLGPLLNLPDAVVDLSPFSHSPSLPGGSAAPGTLVALTAVAALLVAVGLAALGRRDISSGA